MSVTSAARDVRDESASDVVAEAEALPRDRHDLGAFLSRSHGFLPIEPPLTSLSRRASSSCASRSRARRGG